MFELLDATIKPLMLDMDVLEVAYQLYLAAPQSSHPMLSLQELSKQTGLNPLRCRNAIVEANRLGRFPDCALEL
ncbi:MAG: hypothetical protein KME20_07225 [Kaiparowitsia implicata GSE-PSE-MK54-09C]|jgi:hypothetical protein|nr:hypothetical protein [Kaiparowitsia implicata GSE-PSE-MK54-09C]